MFQMRYGAQLMDGDSVMQTANVADQLTSTPVKKLSANGILGGGVERQLIFDDAAHRDRAPHRLNTLRKEGHLCDGVLEVGSRSFAVHRAVLASCSTFFMEQFAGGEDVSRGKIQHLKLNGLDYNCVEVLINYAYTARYS
jgi:kelch-like protein 31